MANAIEVNAEIYQNRDSLIIHRQWTDANRVNTDLTGATIAGSIKAASQDAAALASITFDNDLPNGIIKGYLAEADYAAVSAGAVSGIVVYDVYIEQLGDIKIQAYYGTLSAVDTVTV